MPYTIFGLPTHVLLVHGVVVGLPISCLASLAIAIRPTWRRRFGPAVAGLAVVMVPLIYVTELAGWQLYNHAKFLQPVAAQHKSLGRTLIWFVIAMAAATILLVLADRLGFADHHSIMIGVAGIAIAASAVCAVRVVQVGDSGARAAWGAVVSSSP